MRPLRIFSKVGIVGAGLLAFSGGIWLNREAPPVTADVRALAWGMLGAPRVHAAYASWSEAHERSGGDRNVEILLGRPDMHVQGVDRGEATQLGSLNLDLISGSVEARIPSLPPGSTGYVLWLVDNPSGSENPMSPDASDRFLKVGPLEADGAAWALEANLGPGAFESFMIDSALVVPAGAEPTTTISMAGAPDLFQRIYTAVRTPALFAASDYSELLRDAAPPIDGSSPMGFGLPSAWAARKPNPERTVVSVDVVLDRLIARGADLFINETFDGNGRTCSTCHNLSNNLTLDPGFIASLPDSDPLFVTEQSPTLASTGTNAGGLDVPEILRATALVGIPGPDLPVNPSINRAVTHLRGLQATVRPPAPVVLRFGPDNPPPFDVPAEVMPGTVRGMTIDNATVPPFERAGFGGDLAFVPQAGRFGRARDAVPGATALLLTRSLGRVPGVDFRTPTDLETDAVASFFFSLGRSTDLELPIPLSDPIARRGQAVFMNDGGALNGNDPGNAEVIPQLDEFGNTIAAGKCNVCHFNAGALTNPRVFGSAEPAFARMLGIPQDQLPSLGLRNMNFETGVEQLPSQPANVVAFDKKGRDAGFGIVPHTPGGSLGTGGCANGLGGLGTFVMIPFPGTPEVVGECIEEFNTQPLVEAADTPPFFHNNAVSTIEMAVEFYNTDAFNQSAGARILGALTGTNGIRLEATDVQAIASFLRAVNALDNIREATENARAARFVSFRPELMRELIDNSVMQLDDAVQVLSGAGVNTPAVDTLSDARAALLSARGPRGDSGVAFLRRLLRGRRAVADVDRAVRLLDRARDSISPQS